MGPDICPEDPLADPALFLNELFGEEVRRRSANPNPNPNPTPNPNPSPNPNPNPNLW